MLSYRHAFHAGNFADVLKHIILIQTLEYLCQKNKALCYIDTHAGPGSYALNKEYASKNREYENGIGKLWQRNDLPTAVAHYVDLIRRYNPSKQLTRYPGSPLIAKTLLREKDRLCWFELHNSEIKPLNTVAGKDKRIKIFHDDGLQNSPKLLPPLERRGLILIDPSYELKSDYSKVVQTLSAMHKRFATGTYALWYPVVESNRIQRLERDFRNSGIKNVQLFELGIETDSNLPGMTACGMILINPPWTLAAEMQTVLPWLADNLAIDGRGFSRILTLAEE